MKLLLNDKEIANYLMHLLGVPDELKKIPISDSHLAMTIQEFLERKAKRKLPHAPIDKETKRKFANKLVKAIEKDTSKWYDAIKTNKDNIRNAYFNSIHKNIEVILDKFGQDFILQKYSKSPITEFVKGTGRSIDPNGELMRRHEFNSYTEDCLIRNTVGNEQLLVDKIDKRYPFWFIDSGYTNFLEPNKKWHRLVRNHLHFGASFQAPADRLGNFVSFPKPWRQGGDIIYVIEPGPFAASIFHCDLKTWKYDVEKELRKYTDKKIKFREKAPKCERSNLYKELKDEDYYCVISINSNAATEAIWQGVPAITLDRHITNPVTRGNLKEINDLYRGGLGEWLCMLSYQQFTKQELVNGDAYEMLKRLGNV